ncbi:MAG: hypothetical protein ACMVY4_03720 [Minwuia sp.]|uniref:hypothetical protein n=1 Tax=Minwuia sp. TaxID=2493630 RepID=UPI003A8BF58E
MTGETLQRIDIGRPAKRLRRMWNGARLNAFLPLAVLIAVRGPLGSFFDPQASEAVDIFNTFNLAALVWLPYLVYVSGARSRFAAGVGVFVCLTLLWMCFLAGFGGIHDRHAGVVAAVGVLAAGALWGLITAVPVLFAQVRRNPFGPLALAKFERHINRMPYWWRIGKLILFFAAAHLWMVLLVGVLSAPAQYRAYYDSANERLGQGREPMAAPAMNEIFQYFAGASLLVVVLVLAVAASLIFLARLAQRWLRARAETGAANAVEQPILLLRSFADDAARVRPDALYMRLQFRKRRLEEIVAMVIRRLGAFTAIGSPGERLPPLGARRAYFDDDSWQDAILHWIGVSRFVVLVAGLTEWIQWELRTLIERSGLDRLIVLIPPGSRAETQARLDLLAGCFRDTPWGGAFGALDPDRVLAIMFGEGGEILVIDGVRRDEIEYRLAILAAIRQMEGA